MANKLFKDTTKTNWSANVEVGGSFSSGFTYAIGYYEASQKLISISLSERNNIKDALFFPICFNFRHYVELTLKELIIITQSLYEKSEELGYTQKVLNKDLTAKLNKTHSICSLMNRLELGLDALNNEEIDQDVKDIINELHQLDPNGQLFRYPRNTDQELSFEDKQYYDIEFLSKQMEKVHHLFMGIDGWLDHYNSMADALISSFSPY